MWLPIISEPVLKCDARPWAFDVYSQLEEPRRPNLRITKLLAQRYVAAHQQATDIGRSSKQLFENLAVANQRDRSAGLGVELLLRIDAQVVIEGSGYVVRGDGFVGWA